MITNASILLGLTHVHVVQDTNSVKRTGLLAMVRLYLFVYFLPQRMKWNSIRQLEAEQLETGESSFKL